MLVDNLLDRCFPYFPVVLGINKPIEVYSCKIFRSHYDDSLYHRSGILLPSDIKRSVPKRRIEYLAGRYCTARCLAALGFSGHNVSTGAMREPIWPSGVLGSISHDNNIAISAVASCGDLMALGLDLEAEISIDTVRQIRNQVLSGSELELARSLPMSEAQIFTLFFSLKETFFKAAFPDVRKYFDFDSILINSISVKPQQRIKFEIQYDLSGYFHKGRCLDASYSILNDGTVVTCIAIDRNGNCI
jgi:Phosphopantetheinyl transferase component of siderophore synthetase